VQPVRVGANHRQGVVAEIGGLTQKCRPYAGPKGGTRDPLDATDVLLSELPGNPASYLVT